MTLTQQRTMTSAIAAANIVEVATRIISDIVGNDIANSINSNVLSSIALKALIVSELRSQLVYKEVQP